MKILIVGSGAAGATAAQFARKFDRKAEITIFDEEGYGEYSKCALPMVILGEKEWNEIVEFSPEWFKKAGINYVNGRVDEVDFSSHIAISDGKEYEYDKLIIATGAKAAIPFKAAGHHVLRTMEDALRIREAAKKANNAIVIGAGLIGLEAAEALHKMGIKVKVLEYMPQILPSMLDRDMADYVEKNIDVEVRTGVRVKAVEDGIVEADDDYSADMIIVATGNRASSHICPVCKINKGIVVDERCMAYEDTYAIGDCSEVIDFFGNSVVVGLGSIAVKQGIVAGINAAGGDEKLLPPVWAKTTKIFGMEIASVGMLEGISAKYNGSTLPEYMDGSKLVVKLFGDGNQITGAEIAGDGAALHINKLILSIYKGMSAKELASMETAYAPVVAPAIDAITIAAQLLDRKMRR
ncbi:MAG: FAD-dependent oxidoreductase [Thermoplasmata archaeon]|nr:FAD-dependent oxidoreductase [Thermoplasmata archaeon]